MALPQEAVHGCHPGQRGVQADTVYKGHQVWVGYIVHPDDHQDAVEAITTPDEKSFFLIQSEGAQALIAHPELNPDRLNTADMPIVVKLCGSPLVTLPEIPTKRMEEDGRQYSTRRDLALALPLFQDLASAGTHLPRFRNFATGREDKIPLLRHGLILEDFQAMVAALPEADSTAELALPINLRGAPSTGYWRYWTLLGVDLGDSALRYRLIGQMLGSTFGYGGPRRQRRMGLAVNRERGLTRKALALMQWRQIEVVSDDALNFAEELGHYTKHLKVLPEKSSAGHPASRHTWTDRNSECRHDNRARETKR